MKSCRWAMLSCLAVMLVLATACSSSDGGAAVVGGGPTDPVQPARVETVVEQIIVPMLELVDFSDFFLVARVQERMTSRGGCEIEACPGGGSIEVCILDEASAVVNFLSCDSDGDVVNGSANIMATGPTSFTVSFDVTSNFFSILGGFSVGFDGECVSEVFSGFTVGSPEATLTMNGTVTICAGQQYPNGAFTLQVDDSTSGNYIISMAFDNTATAVISVTDIGTSESFGCIVDLATDQAVCAVN